MGDQYYTSGVSSAVLLTVTILFIVFLIIRQFQQSPAAKEHIRRVKIALYRSWKYFYVNVGIRTAPILILGGGACLLFVLQDINLAVFFYLIGSGVLVTVLWVSFDNNTNCREIDVAFDLHDHIETLDRVNASEIVEGLGRVKFVEPHVPGEPIDHISMRAMINDIAKTALIPTIYRDHHCRDITSYDDPMLYIRTRRDIVVEAFNLGHHEDYLQLVLNRLPAGISFEESVESYVSALLVDVICPSLVRCCETKIEYYELILQDWSMSRSIRRKAKYFKSKNLQYINCVHEICNCSAIICSGIRSRERQ